MEENTSNICANKNSKLKYETYCNHDANQVSTFDNFDKFTLTQIVLNCIKIQCKIDDSANTTRCSVPIVFQITKYTNSNRFTNHSASSPNRFIFLCWTLAHPPLPYATNSRYQSFECLKRIVLFVGHDG